MRIKLLTMIAFVAATYVSQATITLTGLAVGTAYPSSPAASQLGLLIAGTGVGGNAFLNGTFTTGQNGLLAASDPLITSGNAGLTIGSTFGGNTVVGILGTSGTFVNGATSGILAANAGKQFAVVWFNLAAAAPPATAPGGTTYGIVRDSTWVLPADGATSGFATTASASNIFSRITNNAAGNSTSSFGTVQFATRGTVFTIGVPEPSAALLGAFGSLALLRRRRN